MLYAVAGTRVGAGAKESPVLGKLWHLELGFFRWQLGDIVAVELGRVEGVPLDDLRRHFNAGNGSGDPLPGERPNPF